MPWFGASPIACPSTRIPFTLLVKSTLFGSIDRLSMPVNLRHFLADPPIFSQLPNVLRYITFGVLKINFTVITHSNMMKHWLFIFPSE